MVATVIICVVLAALFALSIRYLVKNGHCAGCSEKAACHATAGKGAEKAVGGCGGHCASCGGCTGEDRRSGE